MHFAAGATTLMLLTACAHANDWSLQAEAEVRALIGKESGANRLDERIAPNELSCTHQGGGSLVVNNEPSTEWGRSVARCQDRLVLLLERKLGGSGGQTRWLIVDALLLPAELGEATPEDRRLSLTSGSAGECDWQDAAGRDYYAALHYGDRIEIDASTGVEYAWTFDIERGRIVPVSTGGFSCERVDP